MGKFRILFFLSIAIFYQNIDGMIDWIKYIGEIITILRKLITYSVKQQMMYLLQKIAWKRRKYPSYYSGFV